MIIRRSTASRTGKLVRIVAVATGACAAAVLAWAGPAAADNAPQLACGSSQPGPCSETAHFTNEQQFVTPLQTPTSSTNCPAYLLNDIILLNFSGNGVEHTTVNKAQDAWFTSTFNGTGTITPYPLSSLANIVMDDQGNIISADVVGPADATLTGHLTNWFGGSFNNRSVVFHDTINFTGTDQSGNPVQVHAVDHTSWNANSTPFVSPPSLDFHNANC
jgi:hypothetical protein